MLELIVLSISSLINGLLGLVVYLKNPKSATNKLFAMLTSSFLVWSIVNYISLHPVLFSQLVWVRLVLFFAALLCLSVFLTFTVFPSYNMRGSTRVRKIAVLYTLFVMGLTLTPAVFQSLNISSNGAQPIPGFGIILFVILVISLLGGGIYTIIHRYRRAKGKEKNQLRFVLLGLAGTFGLIFLTNFVFVVAFKYTSFVFLGPSYTLIFSSSLAYAIVKHKLFDIRAIIARSIVYILTLAAFAGVYSVMVFTVSLIIFDSSEININQSISYMVLAVVSVPTLYWLKRFFDHITNTLFYHDAYNSEEFLDRLNRTLVTRVDLEPLLNDTSILIADSIKAEYCVFAIRETSYFPQRVIGTRPKQLTAYDIAQLHATTPNIHHRVIVADELTDEQPALKNLMDRNDIAVLARLVTTIKYNVEGIGYLILGPKLSGNPYTKQDENVIRIVANELVIAVQNALRFEEIEEFNVTLQQKVDSATGKLRRTNEKLEALDATKDEFISMASHQLRTPLTSVKGYISMVLEGDAGKLNAQQRKLLNQSFISAQRMVYLIADLLNVSRLRTGKFVIETHPSNLAEVVDGEVGQLKETALSRGLTLEYQKPTNFPTLLLDETKIRQVVMNFIDNAIYYTPAGGKIEVFVTETAKAVEFRVKDNGIGVPKSERHRLFNKFYRADNARKARPDGTGLGLFMAKKVIIAQGGAIIFNTQEGKGSVFGFSFDKQKLLPPPV